MAEAINLIHPVCASIRHALIVAFGLSAERLRSTSQRLVETGQAGGHAIDCVAVQRPQEPAVADGRGRPWQRPSQKHVGLRRYLLA